MLIFFNYFVHRSMHNSSSQGQHLQVNITPSHMFYELMRNQRTSWLKKKLSQGGSFKDRYRVSLVSTVVEVGRRMFTCRLGATSHSEGFYLISSLYTLRLKAGMSSQKVKLDLLYRKGCFGTCAMPVLSQMMQWCLPQGVSLLFGKHSLFFLPKSKGERNIPLSSPTIPWNN